MRSWEHYLENDLGQNLHLNGLSPVWFLRWSLYVSFLKYVQLLYNVHHLGNIYLQQGYRIGSTWVTCTVTYE